MFDGSGDKKFLVVEEQDSTCLLNSTITIFPQSTWHVMLKQKIHNKQDLDENIR